MAIVSTPAFHESYGVKEAELCNRSLWRIGAETIKDTTEDTKQSRICKSVYGQTRDELLRMYPFTFAVKTVLIPEDATFAKPKDQYDYAFKSEDKIYITGISGTINTNNLTTMAIASLHVAADLVGRTIVGAGIPDGTRIVTASGTTPNISATIDKKVASTITTGTATSMIPMLKILEVAGNPETIFDVIGAPLDVIGASDGRRILCNMYSDIGEDAVTRYLEMKYIEQVVNPDSFDSMFTDALVLRIASKIAVTLSQSPQLSATIQQEFAAIMQLAKNASAEERQIDAPDPWWTDRQDTDERSTARR